MNFLSNKFWKLYPKLLACNLTNFTENELERERKKLGRKQGILLLQLEPGRGNLTRRRNVVIRAVIEMRLESYSPFLVHCLTFSPTPQNSASSSRPSSWQTVESTSKQTQSAAAHTRRASTSPISRRLVCSGVLAIRIRIEFGARADLKDILYARHVRWSACWKRGKLLTADIA